MSTMEIRQSVLQDIALLLDNDQAMEKLNKYVKRLRAETLQPLKKAPSITQRELDERIQASIDGLDASEQEVNQLFEKWNCARQYGVKPLLTLRMNS